MKNLLLISALSLLIFPSCNQEEGCMDPISISYNPDAEKDDESCKYGGTGGSTTLKLFPEHHGDPIVGTLAYPDSVFIEFNAINFPGFDKNVYDLVKAGEDGEDHVHVTGLKPGKYFIRMSGWDASISQRVEGGIPYTLTAESGVVDLVIPVTEGD